MALLFMGMSDEVTVALITTAGAAGAGIRHLIGMYNKTKADTVKEYKSLVNRLEKRVTLLEANDTQKQKIISRMRTQNEKCERESAAVWTYLDTIFPIITHNTDAMKKAGMEVLPLPSPPKRRKPEESEAEEDPDFLQRTAYQDSRVIRDVAENMKRPDQKEDDNENPSG